MESTFNQFLSSSEPCSRFLPSPQQPDSTFSTSSRMLNLGAAPDPPTPSPSVIHLVRVSPLRLQEGIDLSDKREGPEPYGLARSLLPDPPHHVLGLEDVPRRPRAVDQDNHARRREGLAYPARPESIP